MNTKGGKHHKMEEKEIKLSLSLVISTNTFIVDILSSTIGHLQGNDILPHCIYWVIGKKGIETDAMALSKYSDTMSH